MVGRPNKYYSMNNTTTNTLYIVHMLCKEKKKLKIKINWREEKKYGEMCQKCFDLIKIYVMLTILAI